MRTNIFIPQKINVGFQNRSGTYTGKLAYIIYFDEKGVLRKEKSWQSWRDKNIENIIHENIPMSGFVLNKKVGDYSTGWNHRQSYVRIYDPRDFEFEITVENLLYILENTNSIKGKGLEGDFVYGWDGKDLILIPTSSPDYAEISEFNKVLHRNKHIKSKDLILGATYKTKDNTEWIYMGRFDYHTIKYERIEKPNTNNYSWYDRYSYETIKKNVNKGKYYFFVKESINWNDEPCLSLLTLKSLGDKFIDTISSDCTENYAELMDKLECRTEYSPYDEAKDEYLYYNLEEFTEYINKKNKNWSISFMVEMNDKSSKKEIYFYEKTGQFYTKGEYSQELRDYIKNIIGDIEDVFNKYKPIYKNEYLENGKLYRRVN